jgi:hypothetical protein
VNTFAADRHHSLLAELRKLEMVLTGIGESLLCRFAYVDIAVEGLKLNVRPAAIDRTPGSPIRSDAVPAVLAAQFFSFRLGCLRVDFDVEIAVHLAIV